MAIIEQGILGGFRGKCGDVIGYFRNGVACVRSMPSHYRDRRSAAQLRNRGRFTMVMRLMSAVRPVIALGFKRFASAMTEMNVATRVNYYSAVKESAGGFCYNFSGLVLCRGNVEGLSGLMVNAVGSSLDLVWDGNGVLGGAGDVVSVVLLNEDRMGLKFYRGVALRGDGGVTVAVPQGWNGEGVHCYVLVSRGGDWSESCYVGVVDWNGGVVLADFSADVSVGKLDRGADGVGLGSDQSAIKVLLDLGRSGVEKGVVMCSRGGGGVKKRKNFDNANGKME